MVRTLVYAVFVICLAGHSTLSLSQVDTDFWFVVPELSHRGNTGGTPGTLRIATLELPAAVVISMPANPYDPVLNPEGFQDIVLDIPANSAAAVDLTHLIDVAALPDNNRLENKPLTVNGINNFGLHITATNMINAYWEVNYDYGSDLWTLKGSNGLGTLFYTPFQTEYDNRNNTPRTYSAIDIVATTDNTRVTITLPTGKAASFGSMATGIPPGGTYMVILNRGQTFSLFPFNYSIFATDRLAGTRIESTEPVAVSVKDDALNTGSQGQAVIGDQIVPVNIIGDNYIVPDVKNPNHIYVVATEDNTNIYVTNADGIPIGPTPYITLQRGEQGLVTVPNGSKYARITSRVTPSDPFKPFYVFQLGLANQTRGGALVPAIGCTGNTQLAFTRAREGENIFYFFIITERGNEDKFLIDGVRDDNIIDPGAFTEIQGSDGWVALLTNSINANVLPEGQHLVQNTGGIFHLAIMNGFPGAGQGGLYYGYYSDFGALNVGATVAGTNSSVVRACYGDPVQLYAYGGTTYRWTPDTYLDDATSNLPTAINLPPGPHNYTVEVSGACGSGTIGLTVLVSTPVVAHFETNVTSGCSPLEIRFDDQSSGTYFWQYDLGDGAPLMRYDLDEDDNTYPEPPDPFSFTRTYTNTTDQPIDYHMTLLVKNSSGCADILTKTITVFPEIHSDFSADRDEGCEPLEVQFTNNSWGNTDTWLWEFGDGGSSVEENPVHEFRNLFGPGNLEFETRLIAISPYNCRDTSSLPITVSPYIEASFAYDTVAACSPHEIILTDQSIGADIYYWDFGDGTQSTSSGPVIFKVYENHTPDPVTYTIRLRVENNEGCFDEIEREVAVYPEVDASFTAHPLESCSPSEVVFQNNSTGAATYFWDFGDGGTSTLEHPIHRYERNMADHDTIFTVMLVATSDELCRDTAYLGVVIHPYIEAAFTVEDVVGCHPFIITIHNESVGADQYYWDFGDGDPVSNTDAAVFDHTYMNIDDSTVVYPLQLIVFNDEGCSDTMVRYITVHPEITANFTTDAVEGCHPLMVTFTDISVNAVNYLWDFGDGASSVQHSPVHTFYNFSNSDTTYMVTLTTSTFDGECVKYHSWPILVHPQAEAEFTFEDALGCSPFEVSFENRSIGGSTFTWDFGDGTVVTTNDPVPVTHTFVNSDFLNLQKFEVSLVVENEAGCNDRISKMVSVYPAIRSDFAASTMEGCHPLSVDFANSSEGGQTYLWDFGDGSTSHLQDPVHIFTNTGTADSVYTVTLVSVAPNNLCRDTFSIEITVHPFVLANFTINDHLGCSPFEVTLENSSVNGDTYYWDFGDGTDTVIFHADPVTHRFFNPDLTGQKDFEITLVAENYAGCTSEISRTIAVEPDIQAEFTASQVSGCHPLTVDFTNLSGGAAYYHWDFGNGTTSQLTDPSQTFTNIGPADTTYHVLLYATASNNVCNDSFRVDIVVHPYIHADFTFMEGIRCSPSSVKFNNASVGGTLFHWDFGDGTDTVTTDMNPVEHLFDNPGFAHNEIYQVTLTAENAAGCIDQVTRTVEVYPDVEAAFSASVTEGCHPLEVDFDNLSQGGHTYSWDFDDGSSSDGDAPGHIFQNFSDEPITRQVRLVTTSRFNCTSEITAGITIHPKPKARFEIDRVIDCALFDVPVFNTSLNADHYHWDFGDGSDLDTSSMDPFNHVYDNLTEEIATYTMRLTAVSDYGCVDSSQQKIYVYPRTIADFSFNEGGCSPFMAHFMNESVRGSTYVWDFGDGTSLSTTDPTNVYFNFTGTDTTYLVTLTSTSTYGCKDTRTDTVNVFAQPYAEFIASPTHQAFPSAEVSFTNMTNPGNWSYYWEMGDGHTSGQENPQPHIYSGWGNYEISLHVSSPHCADSVSHTIRIFPALVAAEFDTIYPGCEPHTVQFTNRSIYGDSYLWDFDDGTTSTEYEPQHTFEQYGLYNVKLTVTGEGGRDYAYRQVEVYRMPQVDFRVAPQLVMLPAQYTKCFNLSEHGSSYLWDFGDGEVSTDESPSHLYSNMGIYDISLDVWTEDGCTDRLVKPAAVTVIGEGEIFFPNAFKPDMSGPNGGYFDLTAPEKNNIFHPLWEGVDEYHLEIYNRWGEQLFVSDDVNIGWDGHHDGTLCSQGVYVWKCSGTFVNGQFFTEVGDVTLLHHRR